MKTHGNSKKAGTCEINFFDTLEYSKGYYFLKIFGCFLTGKDE